MLACRFGKLKNEKDDKKWRKKGDFREDNKIETFLWFSISFFFFFGRFVIDADSILCVIKIDMILFLYGECLFSYLSTRNILENTVIGHCIYIVDTCILC